MGNIKKRVKRRLPLAFIFLILVIGVTIFMYPKVSNWLSVYTARTTIASYDKAVEALDDNEIVELEKKAEDYNKALADGNSEKLSSASYSDLLAVTDALGYVDIPKIGIYLPIFHDITDEVLQEGVGHMKGTSLPVGGKGTHSVLAAHTGLPSAELFTDIDQLVVGDIFYIHVLGKILAYKVDQIKVVLPYETDDINIVKGEDYVTLLTCTPYGINDHRLLVRGTRIPYSDKNDEPIDIPDPPPTKQEEIKMSVEEIFTYGIIIVVTLVIVIILLILFLPVGKKKRRKRNKDST